MSKNSRANKELRKKFEALLDRKAQAATLKAIDNMGVTEEKEIRELQRLARLARILQFTQPPAPRKRWPLILMLCFTLLVVSLMLFLQIRKTEVELDAVLSEVNFVLSKEQALTNSVALETLGLSGVREVQFPSIKNGALANSLMSPDEEKSVRLAATVSNTPAGNLSLATMILPNEARVGLRRGENKNHLRLSIELPKGSILEVRADATGTIQVSTSNAPSETVVLNTPQGFVFTLGASEVDLDLTLKEADVNLFATNLAIKDPSFFSFEEIVNAEHTFNRTVPTILSGSLYYQELDGQERKLRGSDGLHFSGCKGELRAIEITENGMRFTFVGEVSGIERGVGQYKRNIMPTYLEWLRANYALSLLWGTTLYLFGLAVGLLRWWGWI